MLSLKNEPFINDKHQNGSRGLKPRKSLRMTGSSGKRMSGSPCSDVNWIDLSPQEHGPVLKGLPKADSKKLFLA